MLDEKNKNAGKIGATVSGIGTVGGIGVLAAGASAAEIAAGLATFGGIVGGGMAAGIVLTAAAPLAVAGVGYGIFRGIASLLD